MSKMNNKLQKVSSKITDILPILDINDEGIIEKYEVMDILEIGGKDIFSLTKDDLERDIDVLHSLLKVINSDIKLVSLNFPVDASEQKEYLDYKLSGNKVKVYEGFLIDKKKELEYLEKKRTDKEYYIFLFAPELEYLSSLQKSVFRIIKNTLPIKKLTEEKKELILFKLNNMNSKINIR